MRMNLCNTNTKIRPKVRKLKFYTKNIVDIVLHNFKLYFYKKITDRGIESQILTYGMKSQIEQNINSVKLSFEEEITKQDIITVATLRNIQFKDKEFAKEHIKLNKKDIKTIYEVEINDIDGTIHQLIFELKTYNK